MFRFNHESARWLITKDRYEEAAEAVKKMAKMNKRPAPDHRSLVAELRKIGKSMSTEAQGEQSAGLSTFWVMPRIRMFAVLLTIAWMGTCFGYYGNFDRKPIASYFP